MCFLAVLQDAEFKNIITSICFSYHSDEQPSNNWELIESNFNKNEEAIFLHRYINPSNIMEVFKEINATHQLTYLSIPDIQFTQFNPFAMKINDRPQLPRIRGKTWNTFITSHSDQTIQKLWQKVDNVYYNDIVNRLGYQSMHDFRRNIFHTDSDQAFFLIELPTYARIDTLTHHYASIYHHSTLQDLQVNFFLKRSRDSRYSIISRTHKQLEKSERGEPGFVSSEMRFEFPCDLKYQDRIEAALKHITVPSVQLDEYHAAVPFEQTIIPLSQTIFAFYPLEDFKQHLFTPEQFKSKDRVFQDAVARLLSLAGYSIIILGKKQYQVPREKTRTYEVLFNDSQYPIGSADLIAHRDNELLIIECTTSTPDENKINHLYDVIEYLRNPPLSIPLNITAFIFTPEEYAHNDDEDVLIVSGSKISEILDEILKNEVEAARTKLFDMQIRSPISY
jgi:hypothetical protein